MDDAGSFTFGTGEGDFGLVATGVADELVIVGVESKGKETVGTEGLPATFFAEGEGGGTAAIMEDESLAVVFKVGFNGGEEGGAEIAVFGEGGFGFEVYDFNGGFDGGGFGFGGEGDDGVKAVCEIVVGDKRGGGALDDGGFSGGADKGGEAKGGVFRGVFLVVGGFVGFVYDDEAEIFKGGKEGGAGTDDDLGVIRDEEVFPDLMAGGFGLIGMNESDVAAEGVFKDLDELAGEGDFGDEEDGGFLGL